VRSLSGIDRATLWQLLGEPSEQIGSQNDPRRVVEGGHAFNEKWIHRGRNGEVERVVLWDRSDLVGVFRVADDGTWAAEELPDR
jgi:hypothetical protein